MNAELALNLRESDADRGVGQSRRLGLPVAQLLLAFDALSPHCPQPQDGQHERRYCDEQTEPPPPGSGSSRSIGFARNQSSLRNTSKISSLSGAAPISWMSL